MWARLHPRRVLLGLAALLRTASAAGGEPSVGEQAPGLSEGEQGGIGLPLLPLEEGGSRSARPNREEARGVASHPSAAEAEDVAPEAGREQEESRLEGDESEMTAVASPPSAWSAEAMAANSARGEESVSAQPQEDEPAAPAEGRISSSLPSELAEQYGDGDISPPRLPPGDLADAQTPLSFAEFFPELPTRSPWTPRTPGGAMMPPPRCPAKTSPKESPRLKMSPEDRTPQEDGLQPAAQMPMASSGGVGDAAPTVVDQTLSGTGGLPAAATPREPQQEQEGTAPTAGIPQTPGRASSDMKQAQRLVKKAQRLVAQRSAPGSRRHSSGPAAPSAGQCPPLIRGSGAPPQHQFKQRRRTTGRLPDHVYVDLVYRVRKREAQFVKLKGEPEGEPRGPPTSSGAPPDDAALQDATKTAHSLCGDVEEGAAGALLHQGLIAEGAAGQEALTTEQPAQGAEGFVLPHFFPSEEQQTKEAKEILLALCDTIPAEEYGKTPFGAVFPDGRVEIEAKERYSKFTQ